MAQVFDNVLIEGVRGLLGGKLVLRRGRNGKTIVSARPVFGPNREFSAAQKAHQRAFREATVYAKVFKTEQIYLDKAEKTGQAAYNLAVRDWFHKPQIVALDVNSWSGGAGQPIRIKAIDDIQVTQVAVVISDGNGAVLEQGNAHPEDATWWVYVTTASASGKRRLEITARDRPGNKAQHIWQK